MRVCWVVYNFIFFQKQKKEEKKNILRNFAAVLQVGTTTPTQETNQHSTAGQHGRCGYTSRDRSRRKIKLREKDAPPAEIKRKIVFSDLRNPPNNFTPLFGEVAKYRTLTEKDEQ